MQLIKYIEIAKFVDKFRGSDPECIDELLKRFPGVEKSTLLSIITKSGRKNSTSNTWKCRNYSLQMYKEFMEETNTAYKPGLFQRMAKTYKVQPLTLARTMLFQHIKLTDNKLSVNNMVKDTTIIKNPYLAHETFLCSLADYTYCTIGNIIKRRMGIEYEMKLQKELAMAKLSFQTEHDLRRKAFSKTPDVLLDVPIAVNGNIVKWIESKALFADGETHIKYIKEQYKSYCEIYGPGLIIYWFGFVDEIIYNTDRHKLIIMDHFPKQFIRIDTYK